MVSLRKVRFDFESRLEGLNGLVDLAGPQLINSKIDLDCRLLLAPFLLLGELCLSEQWHCFVWLAQPLKGHRQTILSTARGRVQIGCDTQLFDCVIQLV
jgi:hypothetical protein